MIGGSLFSAHCTLTDMNLPDDVMRHILYFAYGNECPRSKHFPRHTAHVAALCGSRWSTVASGMIRTEVERYIACKRRDRQIISLWKTWHDGLRRDLAPSRTRLSVAFVVRTDIKGETDVFYADLDDAFCHFEQSVWKTLRTLRGMISSTSMHYSAERRFFRASPWQDYRTYCINIGGKTVEMRYIRLAPFRTLDIA